MADDAADDNRSARFAFDHPTVRGDIERVHSSAIPWELLEGKTVLVSGAAGMLPAAMVDALMAARAGPKKVNVRIVALVRSAEQAKLRFQHWLENEGFSLLAQDVTQSLPSDLKPQLIVHAASSASPKFYRPDPVGTMLPNVVGTLNLLNLARNVRTERVLFFSSAEVYGQFSDPPAAIDETRYGSLDPNDNRSCYAESKRMGEALCSAYALQYGVAATIVRPFHTYGPGMKLNDGRVFADFVRDVVNGRQIALKGDGKDKRSFCYLSDATEGFLQVLLRGRPGEAYNIGNPSGSISIADLARLLAGLFSKHPPQIGQPSSNVRDKVTTKLAATCPDITKVKALGWSPTVGLAEGFRRTIDYYLASQSRS
ncbi:NAD-dependent epimerase/dehydratase family protein [Bradyrhizobium sp. URHC0002]